MQKRTRKVVAYISRGDWLLIFHHLNFPEAGLQVPAGTIEPNERPCDAVLREAREETGLSGFRIATFLGERDFDMQEFGRDEVQHRFFFHLECPLDAPQSWRHQETDGTSCEPIVFEFGWVRMPHEVPHLAAGQGDLLPMLFEMLKRAR